MLLEAVPGAWRELIGYTRFCYVMNTILGQTYNQFYIYLVSNEHDICVQRNYANKRGMVTFAYAILVCIVLISGVSSTQN